MQDNSMAHVVPQQPADPLITYVQLMHEVKRRDFSLNRAYDEPDRLVFRALVIDHCYLQFRKILELIAFSILSANQHSLEAIQRGKSRDYHAEKILRSIERKFGSVYPRPIVQIMDPAPGVRARFEDIVEGHLTREDFRLLYSECGDVLHGRSPFRKPLDLDFFWPRIAMWATKITRLLNNHIATIVRDPNLYLVQMNGSVELQPTITTFGPKPKE
jgi:hypothetical protein